ncbi:MAG TPA: IS66 family transposase [Pirellulaceae bacterium]|nr:IS66 family transposase [Pirellulaceae bacterium]
MPKRSVELPDNLPDCHAVIRRQADRIDELESRVDELLARVDELVSEVSSLRRELHGPRRERFIPKQPQDVPPADPPEPSQPRTSAGPRPRQIDSSIPREKVYHPLREDEVPDEILHHPRARRFFRFVREELELPQRRLRVIEHYQEVIVVDDDDSTHSTLRTASLPEPVLERCYVGPSLLAYLAVSRFADHIPYYREEDILGRAGFTIHRSTQWRWMRSLSKLLEPLVELMRQRTLQSKVLGIDETPCPVICPELNRTRSAYLYAQVGDANNPYDCYHFATHKTRKNIQAILGDYQGYLQSDAYICYELITAASGNRLIGVGCWAHARRKFEPLIEAGPHSQATWILSEIQKLYDIEDRAKNMTDEARHQLRQIESRPIVESIRGWLEDRDQQELPRSPLREGVNYLKKRWEVFERFLENGAIRLDNNCTEAALKGPVMGKKAWLFFGNDQGGETAAALFTVMLTCKRHAIDVQAYLVDVLQRIKQATAEDLESLLPDRWIEQHPQARVRQRVKESHAAAHCKRIRRARRRAAAAR